MFNFSYLKDYYSLAKIEFGTWEEYDDSKTDLDFILMLREKFKKSIDGNKIEIKDKMLYIKDFKIYINNKIILNENNSKYDNMKLLILAITISFNLISTTFLANNAVPMKIKIIFLIMCIIICFSYIPFINWIEKIIYKTNSTNESFYKISLEILEEAEKDSKTCLSIIGK